MQHLRVILLVVVAGIASHAGVIYLLIGVARYPRDATRQLFALLSLARERTRTASELHRPNLEALVQARTAELQTANAQLTAEIAACKQAAAAVASEYGPNIAKADISARYEYVTGNQPSLH